MDNIQVRIIQIELVGFKNTEYGFIEMPAAVAGDYFSAKSDILGIYGQNGSGKTAIIEAMEFVQRLLSGLSLPNDAGQYIFQEKSSCTIAVTFAIKTEVEMTKVEYSISLARLENNTYQLEKETINVATWDGEKFSKKKGLLNFSFVEGDSKFTPAYRYDSLIKGNKELAINVAVAKKIAQKEHCSAIFGKEGLNIFLSSKESCTDDYANVIRILHKYASVNLFVISSAHSGSISMNFLIPFAFRLDLCETIAKGDLPIRLDAPSIINKTHYQMIEKIISEMNVVLTTIIPGLSVGIHNFGEQLLEDGSEGYKIQLVSNRGKVKIPLKYESEGIIKIISILNVLMGVYNNSSRCLVIDELDAGIFEYLLGELLKLFDNSAKGQLIFTSHNLRPLEMLKKSSIIFSTTNPQKRYMRMQNVKTNNNLRNLYLRGISLGGQKEDMYCETDTVEISRALRRHCNLHILFEGN